jgi:hypothetical protein
MNLTYMSRKSINPACRPCRLSPGHSRHRKRMLLPRSRDVRDVNLPLFQNSGAQIPRTYCRSLRTVWQIEEQRGQIKGTECHVHRNRAPGSLNRPSRSAELPGSSGELGHRAHFRRSDRVLRVALSYFGQRSVGPPLDALMDCNLTPLFLYHGTSASTRPQSTASVRVCFQQPRTGARPCQLYDTSYGAAVADAAAVARRGTASPPGLRSCRPGAPLFRRNRVAPLLRRNRGATV